MPRTRNVTRAQWQAAQATLDENNPGGAPSGDSATRRSTRSTTRRRPTTAPAISSSVKSNAPATKAKAASKVASTKSKATRSTTSARAAPGKEKGKSSTETIRKKQPLQDITAEIVGQLSSSHPGAAAHLDNTVPNHAFASSLPPSSPPLAFTSSPLVARARQPSEEVHGDFLGLPPSQSSLHALPIATASQSLLYDGIGPYEASIDPWAEFDSVMPEEEDRDPTPRNSDPFGFFALERRLKAEREEEAPVKRQNQRHEAGGRVLVPSTSDVADEMEEEGKENDMHPYGYSFTPPMPPTPHKKKDKGKARAPLGEVEASPRTESMPSTPSPLKPRARAGAVYERAHAQSGEEEEVGNDTFDEAQLTKSKKRTRANKGDPELESKKSAKRPRGSGTPVDPVALAKSLGALLPKRPAASKERKGRAAGCDSELEEDGGDADESDHGNRRRVKSRKGTGTANTNTSATANGTKKASRVAAAAASGKGKAKNGGGGGNADDDDDDDRQERLERERQVRVEYFKRLEGYEVEKENVYVV